MGAESIACLLRSIHFFFDVDSLLGLVVHVELDLLRAFAGFKTELRRVSNSKEIQRDFAVTVGLVGNRRK